MDECKGARSLFYLHLEEGRKSDSEDLTGPLVSGDSLHGEGLSTWTSAPIHGHRKKIAGLEDEPHTHLSH